MQRANPTPRQTSTSICSLEEETLALLSPPSTHYLSRLTLGGAICGTFIGSFLGAFLGVAIGACLRDISLGLDGALLGGGVIAAAGAAYGFALGRHENRKAIPASEMNPDA